MPANGAAIAAGLIGVGLLWSALNNKPLLYAAKSVISGKAPQAGPEAVTPGTSAAGALSSGAGIPGVTVGIPVGVSAGGGNLTLGQQMAAAQGWTGAQWTALHALWERESGWSNTADTRVTGAGGDNMSSVVFAYGIAQARPYSKMPKAAWPPDKGGSASASAQIKWGLAYIAGTYGNPVNAESHENSNGWY